MKQNTSRKTISDLKFFFFLLLFAITFSLYATFYGSPNLYPAQGAETIREIAAVTTTELEIDPAIEVISKTQSPVISTLGTTDRIHTILSIFACNTIPVSLFFLTTIILVFLLLYSNLFLSLPDDWTLVNHRVRLDD